MVSSGKLAFDSTTYDVVQQMHERKNLTELRSLLGLCNVYPGSVENFARIARSITQRLRKPKDDATHKEVQPSKRSNALPPFNAEEAEAFRTLKGQLASSQTLALLRPGTAPTYTKSKPQCGHDSAYAHCSDERLLRRIDYTTDVW